MSGICAPRSSVIRSSGLPVSSGHNTLGDAHFGDWGTQMGMLIIEIARRQPPSPLLRCRL